MSLTAKPDRILHRCPGCGRLLRIPPEFRGQKLACKFCNQSISVPGSDEMEAAQGLLHVGGGTALQFERTWTSSIDKESRHTIIRHPLKHALRGYTLAVECFGPARLYIGGSKPAGGPSLRLGKVRTGEVKIFPLDDLSHAYLWLERGATTTVKVIVTRSS